LREFINRVRMNLGASPALNAFDNPDDENNYEEACPHQKIYGASDLTRIDFAAFLEDVARRPDIPPDLVKINFRGIYLSSDTAVSCGFIFKELLANYVKINPSEKGPLIVDISREGDVYHLVITDCGNHFIREIDLRESENISAGLINFLAQQINGTINFNFNSAEIRLSFSEPGLLESLQL
jgi:two-component sensor histidine kinase